MLGGDPSCPSGAEEDLLASGGTGSGSSGGQSLEKLEVSSDSEETSEVPEWLREGEYVTVGTSKLGIVRYIGPTDFQEGTWVGVELDLPSGERCLGWGPGTGGAALRPRGRSWPVSLLFKMGDFFPSKMFQNVLGVRFSLFFLSLQKFLRNLRH